MGYGGYLIKVGDYKVPFTYILASTFQSPLLGQDKDSYNDDNGVLHRDALKNQVLKVEWQVPAKSYKEFSEFMTSINKQGKEMPGNSMVSRTCEVRNNVLLYARCYTDYCVCRRRND